MDAKDWLGRVTSGASVNAVAGRISMGQRTLNDQVSGASTLKPETVVKIARAYAAEPVAALVELGLVSAEEARSNAGLEQISVAEALAKASNRELLTEIGRRLDEELFGQGEDGDDQGGTPTTPPAPTPKTGPGAVVANLSTLGDKQRAPRTYPKPAKRAARKTDPKTGDE